MCRAQYINCFLTVVPIGDANDVLTASNIESATNAEQYIEPNAQFRILLSRMNDMKWSTKPLRTHDWKNSNKWLFNRLIIQIDKANPNKSHQLGISVNFKWEVETLEKQLKNIQFRNEMVKFSLIYNFKWIYAKTGILKKSKIVVVDWLD